MVSQMAAVWWDLHFDNIHIYFCSYRDLFSFVDNAHSFHHQKDSEMEHDCQLQLLIHQEGWMKMLYDSACSLQAVVESDHDDDDDCQHCNESFHLVEDGNMMDEAMVNSIKMVVVKKMMMRMDERRRRMNMNMVIVVMEEELVLMIMVLDEMMLKMIENDSVVIEEMVMIMMQSKYYFFKERTVINMKVSINSMKNKYSTRI